MCLIAYLLAVGVLALPAEASAQAVSVVRPQPDPGPTISAYVVAPSAPPQMSRDTLIAALRQKIKYVFVIFNENHSFDNEFGTFPGADGIYSDGIRPRTAADTLGYTQSYTDAAGHITSLTPFRIGPEQNSTFVDSVDHSHIGLAKKLDVQDGVPRMDGFAKDEYTRFASKGGPANVAMGTQFARLVLSYIDCDTIPFLWQYASHFTLFDNIFATEDAPSTPNAVAMIAGQSGETQWVKHGPKAETVSVNGVTAALQGPPVVNDPQPFWGSQFDTTVSGREPKGSALENYRDGNIVTNLTFATLPLTFAGNGVMAAMKQDRSPVTDLPDVSEDIPFVQDHGGAPVNWRWYQEGYDHEPTDPAGQTTHGGYVSHHNGVQYFGYISNNPAMNANLRGLGDLFTDLKEGKLGAGYTTFAVAFSLSPD
jgi:phospholipase C